MTKNKSLLPCSGCVHSRRAFLAGCAGCLGATAALSSGLLVPKSLAAENRSATDRMKIRVVFVMTEAVTPVPDWPHIHFDANPVMEKTMNALTAGCPEIEFIPTPLCSGPDYGTQKPGEELSAADQAVGDIDGYIVVQVNCWHSSVHPLIATGKPVLYADFLYGGSGGFLVYTAAHLRAKSANFAHISSGNLADLVAAAKCLPLAGTDGNQAFVDAVTQVRKNIVAGLNFDMGFVADEFDTLSIPDLVEELKTKKMLTFEEGWGGDGIIPQAKETLGIEIVRCRFAELNELWENADRDQAQEVVSRWKSLAAEIIGVEDETLEKSARMYLAMKTCLKNHDAGALTINCLGGFYGNHIFAYPCLGFHELLNEGLIGACECDTVSTLTMIVGTALTKGRPGFISDPVLDIGTKQIVYAHCVASNKVFGPEGLSNPYTILTHSEDRQGASLRSTLPSGYMTTTLEIHPSKKEIIFHQAKAVGNIVDDRACRTKLAAVPVGDYEKLYTQWDHWGWHRVTFYGDLKEPIFALAEAIGFKVVEEA